VEVKGLSKESTIKRFYLDAGLFYLDDGLFYLDAGLLARSQYLEGPATGHLGTGFSWFPCV
jgi:hypothetical protein